MKNPSDTSRVRPRFTRALVIGALMLSATVIRAEVKLTFDTDAQGFASDSATLNWVNDPEFGGCLAITTNPGWTPNGVTLDIYAAANAALRTELENAAAQGGSIKFTVHVRQSGFTGGNPSYFGIILHSNSNAGWIQEVPTYFGGFPLAATDTRTIELPVAACIAGGGIGSNGVFEYSTSSGWNTLSFGTNSGGTYTNSTIYIDDVTVRGAAPPVSGLYTFDSSKLGFKKFGGDPEPAYSTNFGGTLAFAATNDDFHFWANKNDMTGNELAKLKACQANGGTISYDLIAPAGYLSGRGISTVLQNHNPGYGWNQVDVAIPGPSVQTLSGGFEIARVSIPASSFTGLIQSDGYDFNIAFRGFDTTPVTVYFDNLTFSPNSAGSKLTFDSSVQNFEDVNGSTATDSGAVELDSMTNGNVLGAKAIFTSTDSDPQVAGVQASLASAATRGGLLKLKLTKAILPDRGGAFTGVTVKVGYNPVTSGLAPTQQQSVVIPASAFTASENLETPSGFSQIISIPLYATGSTATDGLVLGSASDYVFFVSTEVNNASSVRIGFDDFQVCPAADPKIVYTPALPSGSSGIVGRVITNAEPGATYSATGLPPGVTLDAATGLLSGTPTANGNYTITFSVTKFGMTDTTGTFPWVVTGVIGQAIPVISSFSKTGASAVITWTGTGATPVTVSRSTTLAAGDWTPISTSNTSGTYTDNSPPAGKAFYRVSVP